MSDLGLKLVSVGECTIDQYADAGAEFVGGISLNFAVNAKRCGADSVSLISCAGEDSSERILEKLAFEKVDTSRVAVRSGKTARQKIVCLPDGERIFPEGGYRAGVLADFSLKQEDFNFIQQHHVLAAACFTQVERLFQQVMECPFVGWRVADFLDLSDFQRDPEFLRKYLDRLTMAFISDDGGLTEQMLAISRETTCLIVLTLGKSGSVAFKEGESFQASAVAIPDPVDSTGCGDAFQAAFTVSYWRHRDVVRALRSGAEQAAKVIQHLGALD